MSQVRATLRPYRAPSLLVVGLVMALFLLRAALPAGFMPDVRALRNGDLTLALCLPSGNTYSLSDLFPDDPAAPADTGGDSCPFSLLASPLATPPSTGLPLAAATANLPVLPTHGPDLPAVAHGPPLGPRAPPDRAAS